MNRRAHLIGFVVACASVAALALLAGGPAPTVVEAGAEKQRGVPDAASRTHAAAASEHADVDRASQLPTVPPDVADHPAIARYRAEQALQGRLRAFLSGGDSLSASARQAEFAALVAAIRQEEEAGFLVPAEALALRLALLRRQSPDDAAWRADAEQLTREYRLRSDALERIGRDAITNDPRFIDYKRREAEIVAEVMRMPENAGGRSRSDVLRERLTEARRQAWSGSAGAPGR